MVLSSYEGGGGAVRGAAALRASVLDLLHASRRATFDSSDYHDESADFMRSCKDQTDIVANHTNKGIEFLEKIGTLAKERAAIEDDYASKLRALVKRNQGKKKDDEEVARIYTTHAAFSQYLRELESLAAQHEMVAEHLRKEVHSFVATKVNAHRVNRKQSLGDLGHVNSSLAAAREHMAKQQKAYGKAFKEAEAAHLKHMKAEKNMDISRLDLEKAKNNSNMRKNMAEEAKQSYAHALTAANAAQQKHFEFELPSVLEKFRCLDEERIRDTRAVLEMVINKDIEVSKVMCRCHSDMSAAMSMMNPMADTAVLVEQFRTGYPHPAPFQFEDLGQPDSCNDGISNCGDTPDGSTLKRGGVTPSGPPSRKSESKVARKQSMHQKIFGSGDSKKNDSNGDYASLPPQQRVRRIQAKLAELEKEKEKRIQSRDGLAKMQQAYRDNPKLGNASDCDGQLVVYAKEVEAINQQMNSFRLLLDEAMAHTAPPIGSETPPSSRSESGASSHYSSGAVGGAPPRPPVPGGTNGVGGGVASGGAQRASYSEESVSSEGSRVNNNERRDEVYDEMAMPVLGTCTAVFPFEGGNTEGTIIMTEGQEFQLVERDEGDGWTRVRTLDQRAEGFVPTSYLKCKWYPE